MFYKVTEINIQRIVSYFIAGVTFTELIVTTKSYNWKNEMTMLLSHSL